MIRYKDKHQQRSDIFLLSKIISMIRILIILFILTFFVYLAIQFNEKEVPLLVMISRLPSHFSEFCDMIPLFGYFGELLSLVISSEKRNFVLFLSSMIFTICTLRILCRLIL